MTISHFDYTSIINDNVDIRILLWKVFARSLVYLLLGNDVPGKVNTVGGDGFTSHSFSLSDAVVSVLPPELIGFTSFGLTGIVLKAPPTNGYAQ